MKYEHCIVELKVHNLAEIRVRYEFQVYFISNFQHMKLNAFLLTSENRFRQLFKSKQLLTYQESTGANNLLVWPK